MTKKQIKKILEQHKLWVANGMIQVAWDATEDVNAGERADFSGIDLIGADLTGANLTGAYFVDTNLTRASLIGADLRGACFYCTNLYGAELGGADLSGADLHGAMINHANLTGAQFHGADLHGVNFTGSVIPCGAIEQAIKYKGIAQGMGFPDISWIIPGALCKVNTVRGEVLCKTQTGIFEYTLSGDSLGFIIQDNNGWDTFDMLVEDKIIRGIPEWVKYTGLSRMPEYLGE